MLLLQPSQAPRYANPTTRRTTRRATRVSAAACVGQVLAPPPARKVPSVPPSPQVQQQRQQPLPVASDLLSKPRLTYTGALSALAGEGMCPDKAHQNTGQFPTPPTITKSEEHFRTLGLEFVTTREGISLKDLNELFEKVGFPKRDPAKLKIAIENTYHLIWVRATKQSRYARLGQMVAFGRATSDGVLSATIWDVAVNPSWQRCGLGRALMERLTSRLVQDEIPTITLYAEPNVVGLYEKLGFMKDPDGIRGMAFQRKKKENARGKVPALR